MGAGLISFITAVGSATWIYNRFQRTSGNNTKQSLIAAGISGVVIFALLFLVLGMITKK